MCKTNTRKNGGLEMGKGVDERHNQKMQEGYIKEGGIKENKES